jgi:hypothetical protein
MEQQLVKCPKCGTEIGEVEFYKYHRRCKDCWNAYCKTKRYPNKEAQAIRNERYKENHRFDERQCPRCKVWKTPDNFYPKKHNCKSCYRTPAEIKKAYHIAHRAEIKIKKAKEYKEKKAVKVKAIKEPKVKEIKPPKVNQRKLTQTDVNQRKVKVKIEKTIKAKKEKPIRIPKVKTIVTREECKIKMTETRVYPKVRDVRRGWDDTMAKLRAKFQTV